MSDSPAHQAAARLNRALRRAQGEALEAACDAAMILVDGTANQRMRNDHCEIAGELMELFRQRQWHPRTPSTIQPFELVALIERTLGSFPCPQQEQST